MRRKGSAEKQNTSQLCIARHENLPRVGARPTRVLEFPAYYAVPLIELEWKVSVRADPLPVLRDRQQSVLHDGMLKGMLLTLA